MLRAETASCGLATANNGELLLKNDSAVRHLGGLVVAPALPSGRNSAILPPQHSPSLKLTPLDAGRYTRPDCSNQPVPRLLLIPCSSFFSE